MAGDVPRQWRKSAVGQILGLLDSSAGPESCRAHASGVVVNEAARADVSIRSRAGISNCALIKLSLDESCCNLMATGFSAFCLAGYGADRRAAGFIARTSQIPVDRAAELAPVGCGFLRRLSGTCEFIPPPHRSCAGVVLNITPESPENQDC
jgi:hypothetical protein